MGRASDPLQQFKRALQRKDLDDAFRFARDLPISDVDAMKLTILAGEAQAPVFERMAIRLIWKLDQKRKFTLHELLWVAARLRDAREGHGLESQRALERFLRS
jgi:hypothetical protein